MCTDSNVRVGYRIRLAGETRVLPACVQKFVYPARSTCSSLTLSKQKFQMHLNLHVTMNLQYFLFPMKKWLWFLIKKWITFATNLISVFYVKKSPSTLKHTVKDAAQWSKSACLDDSVWCIQWIEWYHATYCAIKILIWCMNQNIDSSDWINSLIAHSDQILDLGFLSNQLFSWSKRWRQNMFIFVIRSWLIGSPKNNCRNAYTDYNQRIEIIDAFCSIRPILAFICMCIAELEYGHHPYHTANLENFNSK